MPLSDLFTPVVADQLAKFGPGSAGKPAQLNYNVPLPGMYAFDRVVPLDLPADWFAAGAHRLGTSLLDLGVVTGDQGHLVSVDAGRLTDFYRRVVPATARPSLRLIAEVGGDVEPLLAIVNKGAVRAESERLDPVERRRYVNELDDVDRQRIRVSSYLTKLAERYGGDHPERGSALLTLPTPGIGNSIHPVPFDPVATPVPRLALVETWELRSYLGDYGLGRTLQTFSLLPGERTTVTVQTWRTEAATREDATSIFESADTAAQTRFSSALSQQTGSAFQDQGGWAASVSTGASGGANFGLVNLQLSASAGFAANHQESSQRWSSAVGEAAEEHAAQVNNSRRQAVDHASTTSTTTGTATTTVREFANTNLRRVLNFVFRELNQTYETYVVLRDIKVAFYNGNPGSAQIVALADLGTLIRQHVTPARQEEVARTILAACAQRLDAGGDLVTTLQVGANPDGIT